MTTPRNQTPAPGPEKTPAPSRAPAPHSDAPRLRGKRWPWIVGGVALALLLFFAIFDWNWLRAPAERFVSDRTGRAVTIGHFDVRLRRLTPRIVLTDVAIGNPEWMGPEPMVRARELSFRVRLLTLLGSEIILPHLRLIDADVAMVRDALGRSNWKFREEQQRERRNVRVLKVTVDDVRLAYRDMQLELTTDFHAFRRKEDPYTTRIGFAGAWHGGAFEGTADTGNELSLRGSTEKFPMRIVGRAGATQVQAEGTVADITRFRHIDADFAISGPSLASLYQVLKIALPDTPPYRARGRLKRDDDVYSYEGFKGTIGGSDVAGSARYELRKPRPLLTAELKSQTLDVADLGPLIGLKTSGLNRSANAAAVKGDARQTPIAQGDSKKSGTAGKPEGKAQSTAQAPSKATSASGTTASTSGRVLPDTPFNLQKLNTMDADVKLAATRLRLPEQVPLEDFSTRARLDSGVLKLEPLNFGFAGGQIVANVVLDARNDPLAGNVAVDFKRIKLSELFPTLDRLKQSGGSLGAQVRLAGRGNSVAALLGSSSGTVAAGMAGGLISEIAVWLINLNGGELIPLLFGGDRPTPVRCGAAVLDVKDGLGNFSLFVFDTEESRIGGSGTVDLKNERLDITLRPQAKKPGIGSIRGPIRIHGSFRDVDFAIAPQSVARGLGAIALGLVNPVLSLLPLVETGSGQDANCRAVLEPVKGAVAQSGKSVNDAPAGESKGGRDSPAPVVEVPGKGSANGDRQPAAPIVDVPAKKPARASGG